MAQDHRGVRRSGARLPRRAQSRWTSVRLLSDILLRAWIWPPHAGFRTEENAIAEAKSIATKIGSGRTDAITLTRDEVSKTGFASRNWRTGHSLFSAVEGFLAARKATEITPKTVP